jgi:triosephosphate isomerase
MKMLRKLIAGNWKMNGLGGEADALARDLSGRARAADGLGCDVLVCPPFTVISQVVAALRDTVIVVGGQDCHMERAGAHTGDISAPMLGDLGCQFVIVGHSERRQNHGESDAMVKAKAEAALAAGLSPIVCVGETEAEREQGSTLDVIVRQIEDSLPRSGKAGEFVIAYEPVWAIGTGKTATPDDVTEVHAAVREQLREIMGAGAGAEVRILYGGSVKPANAESLLSVSDVDGALVGGASLKGDDFWAIVEAAG